MNLAFDRFPSPIGAILLVSDGTALRALDFHDHEERLHRLMERQYGRVTLRPGPVPAAIVRALEAYFGGDLAATRSIPVETGGTPFQRRVWAALRAIPDGETTTYGAIARTLGDLTLSRAVGHALGANPVPLIVPCHRVLGTGGKTGGFSSPGGVSAKMRMLALEHAASPTGQYAFGF